MATFNTQELARIEFNIFQSGEQVDPIYTESLNGFGLRLIAQVGGEGESPYQMTTYPRGNQYAAVAYDMGTAYISATTQSADACYRWISTIAQHPELFSAMPARRSLINSPTFVASQGADAVAIYNQFDALMADPNTVNFQSPFAGGSAPSNFLLEFWLNRAFDRYVLEDANLDTELAEAQGYATAYQQCAANIPPFDAATQDQRSYSTQFFDCATLVDPSMSSIFSPGG